MGRVASLYLRLYNGLLAAAWVRVFFLACQAVAVSGPGSTFAASGQLLFYAQSAAVLEVFHALFGLVRSPWHVTAVQVGSRIGVLWAVLWAIPEVQYEQVPLGRVQLPGGAGVVELAVGPSTMIIAWSVSEVIRYTFYFCKECGYVPGLVKWLRYSGFLVLYPTGVTSELSVIYLALPYVRQRKLYSIEMPNQLNFAFDCTLLICATAFGYIFGLPMLYSYMLHQRRTALSGKDKRE